MRTKETMMARLNSWLSPDVMNALGWALIHSLWQCLGLAALAAALIAVSSRPSVRYVVGVGALAAMLAAPVATLFVLMRPAALVHVAPATVPPLPSAQPVVSQAPAVLPRPAASSPRVEGVKIAPVVRPLEDFRSRFASWNILSWLVAAWLAGVSFFSVRFAGGFLLLEYKRRSQSTIPNAGILALCQDVQRQLGLERAIRYLECCWLQAPAVIGWLRPIVMLPVAALTGLSEAQLRAVIAHELAHIRRFDVFVNIFQILVETLLFYHPAVWWLNKRIRAERELACDEIAVAASGSRLEYAQALTLMAEWEAVPRLAMAANRGPLAERIFHILGRKSSSVGQRLLGLTGSALFLIAALAAANALVEIAAPPIAHAKASVEAALSTARNTVDHLVQEPLGPATKPSRAEQASATDSTDQQAALVPAGPAESPLAEPLTPPSPDLSGLPKETLPVPTLVASVAATSKLESAGPELLPVDPEGAPVRIGSNEPRPSRLCKRNNNVTGRVISPYAIHLRLGFDCSLYDEPGAIRFGYGICPCKGVIMNVQPADDAEASKLISGKRVTVFGTFQVVTIDHVNYLIVKNARINGDPFDSPVPSDYRPLINALIVKNAMVNAPDRGTEAGSPGPSR
jgi:beta-lactamase regulating signal transducer with metallopeptidase domain